MIITIDDPTNQIYSAVLVEEEGTLSSFCGLVETIERDGLFMELDTDRGRHHFHPPRRAARSPGPS